MECSICQEDYNESENKPYLINPCGHCMCLKCLNQLPNQICPHCRGRIESRTINRGILECVNTFKSRSSLTNVHNIFPSAPSTPIESRQLDKSHREKLLNEINLLNSRLHATFKLKQDESKKIISQTKDEIKQKTTEKKNVLLMHSQDLINKMDQIEEEFGKMEKSSEIMFEKFNKETKALEDKLKNACIDPNELNQAASKLKQSLNKKLEDFETFDIGIQFEPRKDESENKEENSIGFIVSRSGAGPRVSRLMSLK